MFNAKELYDLAIRIEENGERFYRQAVQEVDDPALKDLLKWNADEELAHRRFFMDKKKAARGADAIDGQLIDQMESFVLSDAVSEHAFSLEEADFSKIPDTSALIRTAIGFERDSIMFYEIVGSFISDDETLRAVEGIMEEERRHIELLEGYLGSSLPGSQNI